MGYIDLYLLPVPTDRLDEYQDQAQEFGEVVVEYGGLSYREFKLDDAGDGDESFLSLVEVKEGCTLTSAVAEFKSREHRDEVMAKVMADERIKQMEDIELADMTGMTYGGFTQFVGARKDEAGDVADEPVAAATTAPDASDDAQADEKAPA